MKFATKVQEIHEDIAPDPLEGLRKSESYSNTRNIVIQIQIVNVSPSSLRSSDKIVYYLKFEILNKVW